MATVSISHNGGVSGTIGLHLRAAARRAAVVLASVVLGGPLAFAQCPTISAPSPGGAWQHTIEGSAIRDRNGKFLTPQQTQYGLRQAVRVVVANVNPFRDQVQVRQSATQVTEPAVAAFIKLAFGLEIPPAGAAISQLALSDVTAAKTTAMLFQRAPGKAAAASPNVCASVSTLLLKMVPRLEAYLDKNDVLITSVNRTGRLLKALHNATADDEKLLVDATSTTDIIVCAACRIRDKLSSELPKATAILDSAAVVSGGLERDLVTLAKDAAELLGQAAECSDLAIVAEVRKLFTKVDLARWSVRTSSAAIESHKAAIGSALKHSDQIAAILSRPEHFFATAIVGPFDNSVKATLYLVHRAVGSEGEWTELDRQTLIFGAPRTFTLGFGAAWSGIASRTYGIQTQLRAPTAQVGADTILSRVAIEEESRGRMTPMLTLDARLGRGWDMLGGVSYRVAGSTFALENLEYVLAPGYEIVKDKVLLGVGALIGRQRRLGDGVSLGMIVSGGTTRVSTQSRTAVAATALWT